MNRGIIDEQLQQRLLSLLVNLDRLGAPCVKEILEMPPTGRVNVKDALMGAVGTHKG